MGLGPAFRHSLIDPELRPKRVHLFWRRCNATIGHAAILDDDPGRIPELQEIAARMLKWFVGHVDATA
jgi:hypothetical protein